MNKCLELCFNVVLSSEITQQTIDVIHYMLGTSLENRNNRPTDLPKHKLFKNKRWSYFLMNDNPEKFCSRQHSKFVYCENTEKWYLNIITHFTDDDTLLKEFLSWILQYVQKLPGDFLGFYRYEDTEVPILIIK